MTQGKSGPNGVDEAQTLVPSERAVLEVPSELVAFGVALEHRAVSACRVGFKSAVEERESDLAGERDDASESRG